MSLDPHLVDEAKSYKVNLSAIFNEALEERMREIRQQKWREDNKQAIKAMNRLVAERGMLPSSDGIRVFK